MKITSTKKLRPPRVIIYGDHGVGKTTFAASAGNALFIATEDGQDRVNARAVEFAPGRTVATSLSEVLDAIEYVASGKAECDTLVIDSLDWLEPLVWRHVCTRDGKADIEAYGYGKGYTAATDMWRTVFAALDAVRDAGIAVVCIAHQRVERFNDPLADPYDRYGIKLHKGACAVAEEWSDAILFAAQEVGTKQVDVGFNRKVTRAIGGDRVMHTQGQPAFEAKNRYGLPETLPLSWDALITAITATEKESK